MELISDIDLYYNSYDMENLAYSIKVWPFLSRCEKKKIPRLQFYTLLTTQKLDAEFCVKYILNDRYACSIEEENISDKTILNLQPHIKSKELREAWSYYGILYNKR